MQTTDHGRRRALGVIAASVGVAVLAPVVAQADSELPHIEETDPTGAALGYKHDTAAVDAAKYPTHKPEQHCAKCNLIQGADGETWRPCGIFPGKAVNANGWCAAFVAKPA